MVRSSNGRTSRSQREERGSIPPCTSMSDKKLIRVFPIHCCKMTKTFTFDDFSHDGRMTLVCHNHAEPNVTYITWKSGIDKDDYDKAVEAKKKKIESN